MRTSTDRRLGEVVRLLEYEREKEKSDKMKELAKQHFDQTLEKLWPLKSNEKPN